MQPVLVFGERGYWHVVGVKERYSGKAHDTSDLVDKAKLDIVVFRFGTSSLAQDDQKASLE